MAVQFKKLLPSIMQNTRWGDLATVIQNIDTSIRNDVVKPIFNQFTVDKATLDEMLMNAKRFGWNVLSFAGTYTATLEYLSRELKNITNRVLTKGSLSAYEYNSSVYGLYSQTYAMVLNTPSSLYGYLQTAYNLNLQTQYAVCMTDQEGDNLYAIIKGTPIYGNPQHTGLQIAYTDTINAIETDDSFFIDFNHAYGAAVTQVTRNLTYSYYHKYIENATEWLNTYTMMALENDTNQIHKATERVYYEPWMKFNTSHISGVVSSKTYYNYNFTASGVINSVAFGNNLLNAAYIQFGTGNNFISGVLQPMSGCASSLYTIPSGLVSGVTYPNNASGVAGWNNFSGITSAYMDIDFIISEFNQFQPFTEMAVLNANSGCIYYSAFPKVQWSSTMYNNIRVTINLV